MDEYKQFIEYSFSNRYQEQYGSKSSELNDAETKLMLQSLGFDDRKLISDGWFTKSTDISKYFSNESTNPILSYLSPTKEKSPNKIFQTKVLLHAYIFFNELRGKIKRMKENYYQEQ